MNTSEGLRRVAWLIRVIFAGVGALLLWIGYQSEDKTGITIGLIFLAGGIGTAWVIDGFAKPTP